MPKLLRTAITVPVCLLLGALGACAPSPSTPSPAPETSPTGVLVMAHGGNAEWDAAIFAAVRPLRLAGPTSVALGMADPGTLQAAIDTLERSVRQIVVVRLFTSGTAFKHRTEFLLGLRTDSPAHGMPSDPVPFRPLQIEARVVIHGDGLVDAPAMGDILRDRAAALSVNTPDESVLILAHGLGDHDANEAFSHKLEELATATRRLGFHSVRVATLREDWAEEREVAETELRDFLGAERNAGRRTIVVPFRVYGFGPYAAVLDGLEYEADRQGLLPDPRVTEWILLQANATARANGWPIPYPEPRNGEQIPVKP